MTENLMDPLDSLGPGTQCPGCGSHHTVWVQAGDMQNLFCRTCAVCWHKFDGTNSRVSVETCAGCEYREACEKANT